MKPTPLSATPLPLPHDSRSVLKTPASGSNPNSAANNEGAAIGKENDNANNGETTTRERAHFSLLSFNLLVSPSHRPVTYTSLFLLSNL